MDTNFLIARYGLNDAWTFGILGILMGLWAIGIFIWDKLAKGYGSIDFFVGLLRRPKKGRKRNWKDPMNLRGILYDVQMVTFWEPSSNMDKNENVNPRVVQ
jgi:hypothetical protein